MYEFGKIGHDMKDQDRKHHRGRFLPDYDTSNIIKPHLPNGGRFVSSNFTDDEREINININIDDNRHKKHKKVHKMDFSNLSKYEAKIFVTTKINHCMAKCAIIASVVFTLLCGIHQSSLACLRKE